MAKLFVCFALLCLVGTTFAQQGEACVENKLQELYEFTAEATEIASTTFAYCNTLKAGTSCCASTIVAGFQDDIDDVAEELIDAVKIRDQAVVDLRDLSDLETKLTALQEQAEAVMTALADPENEDATPYTEDQAEELATSLDTLVEDATDNLAAIKTGFTAFQKARATCFNELLNLQAAAWCLACDPAADEAGIDDATGNVPVSDAVCDRLQGSCYDYIAASATLSNLLSVGYVSDILDTLTEALEDVAEDATEATLQALANAVAAAEAPADNALPVALPADCEEDDCEWICTSLFVNGAIDIEALVLGGAEGTNPLTVTETPVEPVEPVDPGTRRLQGGDWAPAADEAGVTVDFPQDPAGLNPTEETPAGAGIIKSGFVCMIALLSVFFF